MKEDLGLPVISQSTITRNIELGGEERKGGLGTKEEKFVGLLETYNTNPMVLSFECKNQQSGNYYR